MVSVVLLALLFLYGPVSVADLKEVVVGARPVPFLVGAFLYCVVGTVVRALRWRVLIEDLGFSVSLNRCTEIFLIGTTFNQVLPTGIGGDVVRTVMLGRDGMGPARAASSVVVERATGMVALLAMGFAVVWVAEGFPPALRLLLLGACVMAAVGGLFLRRGEAFRTRSTGIPLLGRVARHPGIQRFSESFADYSGAALLRAFALSAVFAVLLALTNWSLGIAFGAEEVSLLQWALLTPLIALSLLVPSIAGLGVREWTYVGLLGALPGAPVAAAAATAISLAFHGLNLALAMVGGVLLLRGRGTGTEPEAPLTV
jgi:uncharacterized protein (TIRG00374 family)